MEAKDRLESAVLLSPPGPELPRSRRVAVTAPVFLLMPQVRLPKRLDVARVAEQAADGVPRLFVAIWRQELIGFPVA
jgi:hypothetical protein